MPGFEGFVRRITEGLELPEATKIEIRQEALGDRLPVATNGLARAQGEFRG